MNRWFEIALWIFIVVCMIVIMVSAVMAIYRTAAWIG